MPALTALVLPLHPRLSAISLMIWGLMALIGGMTGQRIRLKHTKPFFEWSYWGPALYFLGLTIGMLWTQQMEVGWFALEVKSTLIILPVLFWFQVRWSENEVWIRHAISAFLLGLGVFMFWRLTQALLGTDPHLWRYDGLAGPFHPTYMAAYLTIGLFFMPVESKYRKPFLFLSSLFIGLLASKAGWIVALGVLGVMLVSYKTYSKQWDFTVVSCLFALIFGGALGDQGRLEEFMKFAVTEDASPAIALQISEASESLDLKGSSTAVKVGSSGGRMQAWSASWTILKRNPLGIGTGDVVDELMNEYTVQKDEYARSKRMNPHSAYWQALVTLGWLGGALLILWWGGMIWNAFQRRDWCFAGVVLVISCHGIFESLLELQQGVVAWVFISILISQQSGPSGVRRGFTIESPKG